MKRSICLVTVLAMCITSLIGCAAPKATSSVTSPGASEISTASSDTATPSKAEYTIKYAYITPEIAPEESPDTMYAYTLRDYVHEKSNGRIKVEIYPAGQLGNLTELVQGVMSGSIEMASANVNVMNNFYSDSMIFGMPGAFADLDECNAILNGEWGEKMYADMIEKMGIRVVSHYAAGFRHFTNNKKEIKTVGDAKGLIFRVMESPVSIKMVEAMGAQAVPISSSEMYVAMQNGVVDGQENPITSIIQDLTYEVQKYLVTDGHFASSLTISINEKFFQSIPADLQQIILDGADVAREAAQGVVHRLENEGLDFLKEKGMIIYQPTPEELAEWHAVISSPTQEYIRSQIGDEKVDAFVKAIEAYRSSKG